MTQYDVVGDYGVQGDEYITLVVEANTVGEARRKFKEIVSQKYPDKGEKIGMHNISAYPITVAEKAVVILGLVENGSWVTLTAQKLEDDTPRANAFAYTLEISDRIKLATHPIYLSSGTEVTIFDPSKFLATRCELRGF